MEIDVSEEHAVFFFKVRIYLHLQNHTISQQIQTKRLRKKEQKISVLIVIIIITITIIIIVIIIVVVVVIFVALCVMSDVTYYILRNLEIGDGLGIWLGK